MNVCVDRYSEFHALRDHQATDRYYSIFIAAAASEPEASEQGADPNFVLWVEIKIFYLAHCMTVPVNFNRGAARSGIKQAM